MGLARVVLGLVALAPAGLIAWVTVPFGLSEIARGSPQWAILATISAGLAGGIALSLAAFALGRASLAFAGAALLLVAAVPLMLGSFGFAVLLSVALLVVASRGLSPPPRAVAWALRAGSTTLVLLWAGLAIVAHRAGVPASMIDAAFAVAALLFLGAAWWPWPGKAHAPRVA